MFLDFRNVEFVLKLWLSLGFIFKWCSGCWSGFICDWFSDS